MVIDKDKILAGRKAVDAYRQAHIALHSKPWHRGVPEEHTPLLIKLVGALDKLGFASAETNFEPKKNEILAKFFGDSDLLNLQELGFADREDFNAKVREGATSHTEIDPETKEEVTIIDLTVEGQAFLDKFNGMWH